MGQTLGKCQLSRREERGTIAPMPEQTPQAQGVHAEDSDAGAFAGAPGLQEICLQAPEELSGRGPRTPSVSGKTTAPGPLACAR